jgi:Winged helix DNA-binding domain
MVLSDIVRYRLENQHLAEPQFDAPDRLVAWLGAVQAQDYAAAKWAVGQRVRGGTAARVEQAYASGTILRTHVLRPTWHFVPRDDIAWMLSLTAGRVAAALRFVSGTLGLDRATLARSRRAIARALRDGREMTRKELGVILQRAGIVPDPPLRLVLLMAHAELERVVCSGAPRGRQHTYALLEARAPAARILSHEEALGTLAMRYFASHGPATVHDYAWWSGLTVADARAGLATIANRLTRDTVNGQILWRVSEQERRRRHETAEAHLLANYDEYLVGYKDRRALCRSDAAPPPRSDGLLGATVLVAGQRVGSWKRVATRNGAHVEVTCAHRLRRHERSAVADAAERYARFLQQKVTISIVGS